MIKTLKLHRYRGFESYQLTDLARVNLVVGKNNCGKTSILEAVELLMSLGHPLVLLASAIRRNELDDDEDDSNQGSKPNISHVFYGHRCEPGGSFELLSPDSQQSLTATIIPLEYEPYDANLESITKGGRRVYSDEEPMKFGLRLFRNEQDPIMFPIGENGRFLQRLSPSYLRDYKTSSTATVRFLNFDRSFMRSAWNALLAEGREAEIETAMRILMPEINSIHFLAGDRRGGASW